MLATITIIVTCRLIGFYCCCDLIGMMKMMMMLLGIDICTYEREKSDVRFLLISFVQCQARYITRSDHRTKRGDTQPLYVS